MSRRPHTGIRVLRGLRLIASVAYAELEAGDCGAWQAHNAIAVKDVEAALNYIFRLCDWLEEQRDD